MYSRSYLRLLCDDCDRVGDAASNQFGFYFPITRFFKESAVIRIGKLPLEIGSGFLV